MMDWADEIANNLLHRLNGSRNVLQEAEVLRVAQALREAYEAGRDVGDCDLDRHKALEALGYCKGYEAGHKEENEVCAKIAEKHKWTECSCAFQNECGEETAKEIRKRILYTD